MLGLKFLCLNELPALLIPLVLIAGHASSRLVTVSLLISLDYVRDDASGKSKPLGTHLSTGNFLIACIGGLLPFLLLPHFFLWLLIPLIIFQLLFSRYLKHRIGGYTGDCLGASQQISEVIFYLGAVILL